MIYNLKLHIIIAYAGLFSGGIMSSGTAIKPWSLVDNPVAQAQNLGKLLNCPTSIPSELVDCLRKMDAYTIIGSQVNALDVNAQNIHFICCLKSFHGLKLISDSNNESIGNICPFN